VIQEISIKRFKRFEDVTFRLDGRHLVLAGPNNTGKSTVLQAISSWSFAAEQWRRLNDFSKHNGYFAHAPVTRQSFLPVPVARFDLLWFERVYRDKEPITIEIVGLNGNRLAMELVPTARNKSTYGRPKT